MFNCGPILLAGTFLAALAEWWAVWKGWKRLEYFAKPTVMIAPRLRRGRERERLQARHRRLGQHPQPLRRGLRRGSGQT